jgi:hypothetical protein
MDIASEAAMIRDLASSHPCEAFSRLSRETRRSLVRCRSLFSAMDSAAK